MAYLHTYGGRLCLRIDTTVSRAEITQRTYVRGVCSNEITLVAFSSKQIPTSIAEHRSRHKKKDKVRDTNCSSGEISFLWNYTLGGTWRKDHNELDYWDYDAQIIRSHLAFTNQHEKNLPWLAYEWDSDGTQVNRLAIGYAATANDDASGRGKTGFDVGITMKRERTEKKIVSGKQQYAYSIDAKINGQ